MTSETQGTIGDEGRLGSCWHSGRSEISTCSSSSPNPHLRALRALGGLSKTLLAGDRAAPEHLPRCRAGMNRLTCASECNEQTYPPFLEITSIRHAPCKNRHSTVCLRGPDSQQTCNVCYCSGRHPLHSSVVFARPAIRN